MIDQKCPFCNEFVKGAGYRRILIHFDSECEGNFDTRPIEDELRAKIFELENDLTVFRVETGNAKPLLSYQIMEARAKLEGAKEALEFYAQHKHLREHTSSIPLDFSFYPWLETSRGGFNQLESVETGGRARKAIEDLKKEDINGRD